jgi:uncharacterized protein (DUF488 family)
MSAQPKPTVYSIGHSNHAIDAFIALLKFNEITALADVRSAPYSRFNSQFNKNDLEVSLQESGIKYVFLGRELGARSDDPSCYENGKVQYAKLANTELFREGIERLLRGADEHRVAMMCAEKDPLDCHRTLLVAPALIEQGAEVVHILADGSTESNDESMRRLLQEQGLEEGDLFRTADEQIADAIARKVAKVAYETDGGAMGEVL